MKNLELKDAVELRKEKRSIYRHRLSITYHHELAIKMDRHFGRGSVLDWSSHGLKIRSSIPIEQGICYDVRFHVEKHKGLSGIVGRLCREGKVIWVHHQDDYWYIGIHLDKAVERLDEYISEEDSCYIFLMPGKVDKKPFK